MNGPLNISPQVLAQEAITLQQKLAAGLQTLPEVEDVHYGATRKEEVWRDGKVVLYRFVGEHAPTARVPLLIAYALVNRPYMVDLQSDRSLVKGLLARGEDVYILDWGYPDRSDRFLMLDDYINRFIDGAVDHLRERFGLHAQGFHIGLKAAHGLHGVFNQQGMGRATADGLKGQTAAAREKIQHPRSGPDKPTGGEHGKEGLAGFAHGGAVALAFHSFKSPAAEAA